MVFSSVSLCVLCVSLAAGGPRPEISLDGMWQHQRVAELADPPAGGEWKPCPVPGYLYGVDYQRAWFRRSFTVPEPFRGKRITLHFGGVKYNSRVYVNGKRVGGCFGGYEPFDIDVTDAVRQDRPNELAVGCHDWTGVFTPGKVAFPKGANWDAVRGTPRDKILSPIGGLFESFGLWDNVVLRAHPAVHVQDVFIRPSVRRGELAVDVRVANDGQNPAEVELRAVVEDRGKDVLQLPSARLTVRAGKTVSATLCQSWQNPPLWSPCDPHLLHVRIEASGGDVRRERFGFREFWTEGDKFFLNGSRINLLATSWWPPREAMSRQEIRQRWEAVKRMGCVAFRTHTQPWPSLHYEVADEVGLLVIVEGAVFNDDDAYRIDDPVFWDNYARQLRSMVERDKNRPSVVLWSLENEFFGGRLNDAAPAKKDLVRMGRLIKQWDPTRPIVYESDGDPGGMADCIGIHYPHEYPDFTCWPNEGYWLKKPAAIPHMFLNGAKEFVWKRDKPLYIGEFLWVPSSDPSWNTVFYGDEAYRDYNRYRLLAKCEAWKMQILAYRRLAVGGLSPWTVQEGPLDESNPLFCAHQYAYQPVTAYPIQYNRRFFAGQTIPRQLVVFNEREAAPLEIGWTLRAAGAVVASGKETIAIASGDQRVLDVRLPMPVCKQRTPLQWEIVIRRNGAEAFRDCHELAVLPRPALPHPMAAIGLYDPAGATRACLEAVGVHPVLVKDLSDVPQGCHLLVIGDGAFRAEARPAPVVGSVSPQRKALLDFVARGGRVLVLRQDTYPDGLLDATLAEHRSTMTFPAAAGHPALRGVAAEDLKFWGDDHMVSDREPTRPARGGFTPIVVSGSAAGLDHAPLLEQAVGAGRIVYSQLRLIEKQAVEPAAAAILANLLDYLGSPRAAVRKTALVGGTPEYAAFLRGLGLRFDSLQGKTDAARLAPYGLVVWRGDASQWPPLLDWVAAGGNLLVHRPNAEQTAALCRRMRLNLAVSTAGPVVRAEGHHPLLDAIAREDLYWLGRHEGIDWAETPRADRMADAALTKTFDGASPAAHSLKDWQLEGGLVERTDRGVTFATIGTATRLIDFPVAGEYILGIVARSTPCDGGYARARIAVDDRPLGEVSTSADWATSTVVGRIAAGKHKVSVSFVNDASNATEDRNLYVEKFLAARDERSGEVALLTSPAAMAAAPRGKGMVVFDMLRWDTEQQNARKAARLAASLLTALGGDFPPRLGVLFECERMTPQPGMPFFSNAGSYAAMACNGYIETPLEIAASGRYTMELVASGSPAAGVYPLVEILLDGKAIGRIQLTSGGWRSYYLDLDLLSGQHKLRLAFVNDFSADGEDRNVMLDKASFYRAD